MAHTGTDAGLILNAMELAGVGYAITDADGRILSVGRSFEQQTGLDADPDDTRPWFLRDHARAALKQRRTENWRDFQAGAPRWQGMVRWYNADGTTRFFEGTALRQSDGRAILVTTDRTDRVEAAHELREAEKLQRQVLDELPLWVSVHAVDGRIIYTNRYLAARLNVPPDALLDDRRAEILGPEVSAMADQLVATVIAQGGPADFGPRALTAAPFAGQHWLMLARALNDRGGGMIGVLMVMVDRTDSAMLRAERTRFAAAVHETQKVEAINNFAGTLAHELANLLHPLAAYARMLAADPDHPSRAEYAAKINQTAMIAGRLVRRTLGLARTDSLQSAPIDVAEMVDEILAFARDLAPNGLIYEQIASSAPVPASVRAGELRQVLLNLLTNAAEAMHYRGQVTVELATGLPHPINADIGMTGRAPFSRITVRDNGPGIPEAIRARIFEPFYTTKANGRGTGLGLAVVQGLAIRWGGGVTVESGAGGAAFHVWLPAADVAGSPASSDADEEGA